MISTKPVETDRSKQIAHNEQCLLGACLLNPSSIDEVATTVRPEMFTLDPHAKIFSALRSMCDEGHSGIDAATVCGRLDSLGQFAEVGADVVAECMEAVPHAAHARYYAKLVREEYQRRQLRYLGMSLIQSSDRRDPIDEILARAEGDIHATIEESIRPTDESIGDILAEATIKGFAKTRGVETGFAQLDHMTNGLQPGQLIYVAARPSMGKSAFAMNLAQNICEAGKSVLFVSLEMTRLDLSVRLLCRVSGLSRYQINSGRMDYNQRILEGASMLNSLKMFISDQPSQNAIQIGAMARLCKRRKNIACVIVDYLQFVEPEDHRVPREQQVSRMSKRFKNLAKSLGLPVVVLAQLNRESEKRPNKRPMLSDLRESGSLEQDADIVMLLHRPGYYDATADQTEAELIVAKHRNGETKSIKLSWHNESTTFREAETCPEGF